jgi:hypothetical protein
VYARDNPINITDPSGLNWLSSFFKAIIDFFSVGFGNQASVNPQPTFPNPSDGLSAWDKLVDAISPHMSPVIDESGGFGQGFQSSGGGTSLAAITGALGPCLKSLFGVTLISFSTTVPGKAGIFQGSKAGVFRGVDQADASGPYVFDVINSIGSTREQLGDMYNAQNPAKPLPSGAGLNGYTPAAGPLPTIYDNGVARPPSFIDYTAKDQDTSQYLKAQIWELGNSLSVIDHLPQPQGTPKAGSDPSNQEWGHKLLDCYNGKT